MDYYPENILLEITALLNAPQPPLETGKDLTGWGLDLSALQQIWWLEWYLRAEPEAFREKIHSQPLAEQRGLAAQVYRWFLYRPRLQRLYPERSGSAAAVPWNLARGGSLVTLAGGEAAAPPSGIFFIVPHSRIWPDLLTLLDWQALLDPAALKALEADLAFASRSRLAGARERSEQLRSLLTRPEPVRELATAAPAEEAPQQPPVRPFRKPGKKKKPAGQLHLFE